TQHSALSTRRSALDTPFWGGLAASDPVLERVSLSGDDLLGLLYTSGTTGDPKGVPLPIKVLAWFSAYVRFGLDLREDDVVWTPRRSAGRSSSWACRSTTTTARARPAFSC